MIGLIDQVKNPVLRAFLLRVYNTLIAGGIAFVVLVAGFVLTFFIENGMPTTLADFANKELWDFVAMSVVMAVLTSLVAGSKKASRKNEDIKAEESK